MKGLLNKIYVVVDYCVIPMQDKKIERHCRIINMHYYVV